VTSYRIGILGIAAKSVYRRTGWAIIELSVSVVYRKWKIDDGMTNILTLMDRPEMLEGPLAYCGMRKTPFGVVILSRRGGIIYLVQGGTPFSTRQEFLMLHITKGRASSNIITAAVRYGDGYARFFRRMN